MKGRRLAFWLSVLFLGSGAGAGLWAQTVTVRIGGVTSSLVGLPFDVPIEVDLGSRPERLGSFNLRLEWNPAVLKFLGGRDGTFGSVTANLDSVSLGVVRIAGVSPSGAGPRVILGVGEFVPLGPEADTFRLSVQELYAAGTFADLLPSAQWSDRAYCLALGRYGDVDGERSVSSRDALLVLTHAVGLSIPGNPALGDVDGDGVAGARDALIILSSAVGIDVTAFRILAVAPGPCAAPRRPQLALVPGPVTFDLGQSARYVAVAADSTGTSMAVTDVVWSSSDDRVVTVSPSGVVTAVGLGTATVRAVRTGGGSASAPVTVVRRTSHWVSAFASPEPTNQLGAPELPFGTIQRALDYARAGDTVWVGPGRYEGGISIQKPVTLIGDTGAARRPRLVQGGSVGLDAAVIMGAGGRIELHGLALEGFSAGIAATVRVDTLVLGGLVIRLPLGSCALAGVSVPEVGRLHLRGSLLVGDGRDTGCAAGVYAGSVSSLLVEDVAISDFGWSGVVVSNGDTVTVRRSVIRDNYAYGIELGGAPAVVGYLGAVGSGTQTSAVPSWQVEDSRLLQNGFAAVFSGPVNTGTLARSRVESAFGPAVEAMGDGTGYLVLVGDTILNSGGAWVDLSSLDSARVDNTLVVGAPWGSFYNVGSIRVSRSLVDQVRRYGTGVFVGFGNGSPGPGGGRLYLDSVAVRGESGCYHCGSGVYASSARVFARFFAAENLAQGLLLGDSAAEIVGSRFHEVGYGIYAFSYQTSPPHLRVLKSEFSQAYQGVTSYNFVTVVDSSRFTVGDQAISLSGSGVDTLRYNEIVGYTRGAGLWDTPTYAAFNSLSDVHDGFYASAYPPGDSAWILVGNTVGCSSEGALYGDGFFFEYVAHRAEGNTVVGCGSGILAWYGDNLRSSIIRDNSIALSAQAQSPGIRVSNFRATAVGNRLEGGGAAGGAGGLQVLGALSRAPYARVDSNTIRGARGWGILVQYVDSVQIRGNLLEDIPESCCYPYPGAVGLASARLWALVARNTVRRVAGVGVAVYQPDTALVVLDTNAISAVDSAAVRLSAGRLQMRGNNIRNNSRYGVEIATTVRSALPHLLRGNAFKGNARYAVFSPSDTVDARENWWGVDGALPGTSGADSVLGGIDASSPLSAEPSGLLPLAPSLVAEATPVALLTRSSEPFTAGVPRRPGRQEVTPTVPWVRESRSLKPVAGGRSWEAAIRLREERQRAIDAARAAAYREWQARIEGARRKREEQR